MSFSNKKVDTFLEDNAEIDAITNSNDELDSDNKSLKSPLDKKLDESGSTLRHKNISLLQFARSEEPFSRRHSTFCRLMKTFGDLSAESHNSKARIPLDIEMAEMRQDSSVAHIDFSANGCF